MTTVKKNEEYYEYDLRRSVVTYYRIKVTSIGSRITYSPIVKVVTDSHIKQDVTLYPNPVTGRQFALQMNNIAGNYLLRICAANGQLIKQNRCNIREVLTPKQLICRVSYKQDNIICK